MVFREIRNFIERGKGGGAPKNEHTIEVSEEKKREIENKLIKIAKLIPDAFNFRVATNPEWKNDIKICFELPENKALSFLAYDSKRNSIKAWPYGIFPIEELKKNFPSHNYYIEKGSDFYIIPGISEESLSLGEESSVGDLSLTDDPRGQLSKSDNKDGATSFTDEDKKDQEK